MTNNESPHPVLTGASTTAGTPAMVVDAENLVRGMRVQADGWKDLGNEARGRVKKNRYSTRESECRWLADIIESLAVPGIILDRESPVATTTRTA